MQPLSCPVTSSFATPLGRANAASCSSMAGALQDRTLSLCSCIACSASWGVDADCEGMGCVHKGIAELNQVYQGHATCIPLLLRELVQLCVSVPTWNQKQWFLDSGVTAVTNFKPRS